MECSSLSVPSSSSTGSTVDLFVENRSPDKVAVLRVLSDGTWEMEQVISESGDWHGDSHSGAVWLTVLDDDYAVRRLVNDQCYIVLTSTSPFTIVVGDVSYI